MKATKSFFTGALIVGGMLTVAAPALADHRDRRRDLRELESARRELRKDLRRGAGPEEIARDRAAIARERRDLRRYRDRDRDYWAWNRRYRNYDREHNRWHRQNDRHYNRSDRWDWGWHRGWWR